MSKIKSFSVGEGDVFYIKHNSDNFTIIDCCLSEDNTEDIVNEIIKESKNKDIKRFISTHPDKDHVKGLKYLDDKLGILNFYCVKNNVTKTNLIDDEIKKDFKRYYQLRDSTKKAFYIYKGCKRKWMNMSGKGDSGIDHGSVGINILWPDIDNEYFIGALEKANDGDSPNNISPIIKYSLKNGVTAIWIGDLETSFMENIIDEVNFSKVNILFAPHHGRDTGKVPQEWLDKMDPDIIVIGEAPSEELNYYKGYNTITQNSAGDITFICNEGDVDIYVSDPLYSVDFLNDYEYELDDISDGYYLGMLDL